MNYTSSKDMIIFDGANYHEWLHCLKLNLRVQGLDFVFTRAAGKVLELYPTQNALLTAQLECFDSTTQKRKSYAPAKEYFLQVESIIQKNDQATVDTATKVLDAIKMQFAPPSLATQVRLDELLDQLSYDSKADPLHLFNQKICVTYL
ncbi:hypothetical protein MP228_005400 [Amoeboaphelidium protococcarum]|nr:hypothetical protein MP228_005400 [Amoeboaphelidium protococcarum]